MEAGEEGQGPEDQQDEQHEDREQGQKRNYKTKYQVQSMHCCTLQSVKHF